MPSKTGKQHRLMEMVAHNPAAAHRLGIPQKVGHDFVEADKAEGKHFAAGHDHRKGAHPDKRSEHEHHMHGGYHG